MASAVHENAALATGAIKAPPETQASWETKFNTYVVDSISSNINSLRLKTDQGTLMKVIKVAVAALAFIALLPLYISWVANKLAGLCKKTEAPQQSQAPLAEEGSTPEEEVNQTQTSVADGNV